MNEMEPDDNTANENEGSVASDSVVYVIFNCSMNLSGEFEVGAWNFQSGSWDPHIWPNKGPKHFQCGPQNLAPSHECVLSIL